MRSPAELDTQSQPAATDDEARPALLDSVIEQTPRAPAKADGIAVGTLESVDADGTPRVGIPAFGLTATPARMLVPIDADLIGQPVALGFEANDPRRPIILGRLLAPAPQPAQATAAPPIDAIVDGERVTITGEQEIELRCGDAAIVLSADGRIHLRATHITSHASASQRIVGGSVNVN